MAGTLVANTINTDTGLFSTQNAYTGVGKAWVNFNGNTGGAPTIRAFFNVSSVTTSATGKYTINFATAMVDANYVISGTAASNSGSDNYRALAIGSGPSSGNDFSMTTTACNVQTVYTPGPQLFNCNYVLVAITGN